MGRFFWKRFLPRVPWRVGPSKVFKKIKKIQKSKKAQNRFQKCPHVFWTCFGRCFWKFFAQCSMQCISDFLDWKIWAQFYDTTLNRHSFCIQAAVNIRNSTSDVLDLKLWVQIPELKNMSSVFRTWKMWVQFSGLKFWGRDLEKIKGKNQKNFKVPKMSKNVSKCPNVFWGDFFENIFLPSVPWSLRKFSKKSKKFQNCRNAQKRCQNCPNLFWTCFVAIFSNKNFAPCSMEGRVFENFQNNQKNFKNPKLTKVVFKGVQRCFEHALRRFFRISLPSVPCRAFQIFWT